MTKAYTNLIQMLDISAPKHVEITIDEKASTVWINVDGMCRFRACRIKTIILDNQTDPQSGGKLHPYIDPHPEEDE